MCLPKSPCRNANSSPLDIALLPRRDKALWAAAARCERVTPPNITGVPNELLPGGQTPDTPPTLDDIAAGLQRLRLTAGNISYQDIATRITQRRLDSGLVGYGAKVARSTVYACFRTGRARVNADLVAEIVSVLTDDAEVAAQWRAWCLAAHSDDDAAIVTTTIVDDAATTSVDTQSVAPLVTPQSTLSDIPVAAPTASSNQLSKLERKLSKTPRRLNPQLGALVVLAGVILNLLPPFIAGVLFPEHFPLFLDMIGSAMVALAFGPLLGIVTAILTMIPQAIFAPVGMATVPFWLAPVPIAGVLIWAFGVRRFNMGRSLTRFTLLNIIVGVVCSLIAFPIIINVFGGHAMQAMIQQKVDFAVAAGTPLPLAVLTANMVTSIVDKTLVGIVAIVIAGSVLRSYAPSSIVDLVSPNRTAHHSLFKAQFARRRNQIYELT